VSPDSSSWLLPVTLRNKQRPQPAATARLKAVLVLLLLVLLLLLLQLKAQAQCYACTARCSRVQSTSSSWHQSSIQDDDGSRSAALTRATTLILTSGGRRPAEKRLFSDPFPPRSCTCVLAAECRCCWSVLSPPEAARRASPGREAKPGLLPCRVSGATDSAVCGLLSFPSSGTRAGVPVLWNPRTDTDNATKAIVVVRRQALLPKAHFACLVSPILRRIRLASRFFLCFRASRSHFLCSPILFSPNPFAVVDVVQRAMYRTFVTAFHRSVSPLFCRRSPRRKSSKSRSRPGVRAILILRRAERETVSAGGGVHSVQDTWAAQWDLRGCSKESGPRAKYICFHT